MKQELHEGGEPEYDWPESKEVPLDEIERRWFGVDNTITSSRALVTSPKQKSVDESQEAGLLISKQKFDALQGGDFEIDTDLEYEDKYGDVEMLEHESKSSTNFKTFMVLIFLVIACVLSAATCAYWVFYFENMLALYCLIMLIVGFFIDILIIRPFYCFMLSIVLWIK